MSMQANRDLPLRGNGGSAADDRPRRLRRERQLVSCGFPRIAIPFGPLPTGMVRTTVWLETSITETLLSLMLVTYAKRPSGAAGAAAQVLDPVSKCVQNARQLIRGEKVPFPRRLVASQGISRLHRLPFDAFCADGLRIGGVTCEDPVGGGLCQDRGGVRMTGADFECRGEPQHACLAVAESDLFAHLGHAFGEGACEGGCR